MYFDVAEFREIQIYDDLHPVESVLSKNFNVSARKNESPMKWIFAGVGPRRRRTFAIHGSYAPGDPDIVLHSYISRKNIYTRTIYYRVLYPVIRQRYAEAFSKMGEILLYVYFISMLANTLQIVLDNFLGTKAITW